MRERSARRPYGPIAFVIAACAAGALSADAADEAAAAEDPVGRWKLRCTSPDGKARESVLTVVRHGTALRGELKVGATTNPAREVGFARGELSFRVDGQYAGQVYGLHYKGRPRGNAIRGTVHWTYSWASGSFAFEGERVEPRVASAP